eukprot:TRINITY_DN42060_c0_g1_i1.p1 TRINITY_DN42060_c0_g1~~TRINITY_DN42060_c0_g1_i1.p1  ORF type:complete len:768 (-),score=133.28 TRINITY_DN42060_c0_g1_i1:25-1992(-)
MLPEFERAAAALPGCSQLCQDGGCGQKPFLCAVSINCERMPGICDHYLSPHREPFDTLIHPDPRRPHHPPEGWLRSWPTSDVILIAAEEFKEHSWAPAYWRIDDYDSAGELLIWARSRLDSLPATQKQTTGYTDSVHEAWKIPSRDEFRESVLRLFGATKDQTYEGCLCRDKWQSCNGGFFGHWQSCQEFQGCSEELQQCETVARCSGGLDGCRGDTASKVASPALQADGADTELAAAVWLHLIFKEAEFPARGRQLTSQGRQKRQTLLTFVELLCLWFPHDRVGAGSMAMRIAASGIFSNAAQEATSKNEHIHFQTLGRRLWFWGASGGSDTEGAECRSSLCSLKKLLEEHWDEFIQPASSSNVRINLHKLEEHWQLCNRPWHSWSVEKWQQCRGSFPRTRQLPCGIWVLLHRVVAHSHVGTEVSKGTDVPSPAQTITAIRTFIREFMDCPLCVRHMDRVPFDADALKQPKDAVLWLWFAHNYINRLVSEEPAVERAFGTDPAVDLHHSWPGPELCAVCASSQGPSPEAAAATSAAERSFDESSQASITEATEWNLTEVYRFLVDFYGPPAAYASLVELPGKPVVTNRRDALQTTLGPISLAASILGALAATVYGPMQRLRARCARLRRSAAAVAAATSTLTQSSDEEERQRLL